MELMKTLLNHLNEDIKKRYDDHRRKSFYQSHAQDELDVSAISALESIAKAVEKTIEEHTVPDDYASQWEGVDGLEQA